MKHSCAESLPVIYSSTFARVCAINPAVYKLIVRNLKCSFQKFNLKLSPFHIVVPFCIAQDHIRIPIGREL